LEEGNWYLEKTSEFDDKPTEVKRKKFEAKDFMTEE
jgi:hypothetical protein